MNTKGPLDPRIEKLVAHLYGELPENEAREVERMIEADPEIRREWEELRATRSMLAEWKVEEESPGFVFIDDRAPGRGRAKGWLDRFRSLALATPWAVATAAVVVAVLAATGAFRIERTNGSIAFRFGRVPAVATQLASNTDRPADGGKALVGESVPLGVTPTQPVSQSQGGAPEAQPVSGQYLTKKEFEAYSAGVMQTLVVLLNEYGKEHDREIGAVLQTALTDVANKQVRDYSDLRSRIEVLGVGVGNLDYRLQQHGGQVGPKPAVETPATGTKGEGE